ncbi:amidohydrolase family protein [Candidatus Korobacter versatilis]|nr:amidohydrolase family protein [Candidatus Koribacter versatilis]
MLRRLLLFAFLVIPVSGWAQKSTVLHDVNVVDVRAGKIIEHRDVVIEGERIRSVGAAGKLDKSVVVLHTGGYVMPGLWDMHVHLAGVSADGKWSSVLLNELLNYGITSVRDMGSDIEVMKKWRGEISEGKQRGPNLYFGGPMLSTQKSTAPEQRTVRSADDAVKAVDELKAQGADFIKILHIPRAAYFPLSEEAKRQGIDFVGHLPYGVTVQEATAAGQRSIEHINWSVLALDCSGHPKENREKLIASFDSKESDAYDRAVNAAEDDFDEKNCAAVAEAMVQHGTWLVPTLVAEEIGANVTTLSRNDAYLKLLPKKLQEDWSAEKLRGENSDAHMELLQREWKGDQRIAAFLHKQGVRMLAGSDSLDVMDFPGPSLHRELELLVKMGMTPTEALRAATLDAAEFMRKDRESGSVEAGKTADLVVLRENPLKEISNTRTIEMVIKGGEVKGVGAE